MMTDEQAAVGKRIRSLREQQGLSLRAVSERCGLSINAISKIERGENSPTVSSLHMLATALKVSITDFFRDEEVQTAVLVHPDNRLRTGENGVIVESLGIGLRYQQLEPFLVTLEPGAGTLDQPVVHTGEEFVFCQKGTVIYRVGEREYTLDAGHSLLFEADQTHGFVNIGKDEAQLLMVFLAGAGIHLAQRMHGLPVPDGGSKPQNKQQNAH